MKFITILCTANIKNVIKYELKKERLSGRLKKDFFTKKRIYDEDTSKKRQAVKKRHIIRMKQ